LAKVKKSCAIKHSSLKNEKFMLEFNVKITPKCIIILLLLVTMVMNPFRELNSQSSSPTMSEAEVIALLRNLKDGVLIVRLESNRKKIAALEDLVKSTDLSEKQYRRIQKQLDAAKFDARAQTVEYLLAFKLEYDFSEVVFMFDYQTAEYKKDEVSFFDVDERLVHHQDILSRDHLVLSQGSSPFNGSKLLEFLTDDLKPIGNPAPKSHFGVFSFITPKNVRIKRLNKKLHALMALNQ
jgi:hypothetical protein